MAVLGSVVRKEGPEGTRCNGAPTLLACKATNGWPDGPIRKAPVISGMARCMAVALEANPATMADGLGPLASSDAVRCSLVYSALNRWPNASARPAFSLCTAT